MKALGVLGTSSSVGKSWMTTAYCAWLHQQGVRVAPFKAQNMSNNACAASTGVEIARAQAVQAEACGLRPVAEMNPILLKPSGGVGAQLVLRGVAQGHVQAREYYTHFDRLWGVVTECIDFWRTRCDVLVLEGAGSPVELNLLERDLVNLRPLRYLDARWLLVADIDRGGVYAQLAGTWALLEPQDRSRCLGAIVNRFRGDISLFPDPTGWLAPHAPGLPVLGTVPMRRDLQPEEEDGLSASDEDRGTGDLLACIRLPNAANLTDLQPWWDDKGVRVRWVSDPEVLTAAKVIVLPGSKNTLADLRWLRASGLAEAIVAASRRGTLVIGICGGYQLLGSRLVDTQGVAGDRGDEPGLGLLPVSTRFEEPKIVREVTAECGAQRWEAYEIHMGRTEPLCEVTALQVVTDADGSRRPEGVRLGRVWGTYLHGWFESPELRKEIAREAGFTHFQAHPLLWMEQRRAIYRAMAEHLVAHVDLDPVRRHLGL